jgi:hypothetical protein
MTKIGRGMPFLRSDRTAATKLIAQIGDRNAAVAMTHVRNQIKTTRVDNGASVSLERP